MTLMSTFSMAAPCMHWSILAHGSALVPLVINISHVESQLIFAMGNSVCLMLHQSALMCAP
jgi:hypothetical protein